MKWLPAHLTTQGEYIFLLTKDHGLRHWSHYLNPFVWILLSCNSEGHKHSSFKYTSLYILTPEENQSPGGVGFVRDFMASTIDTAVDAAEDLPHF